MVHKKEQEVRVFVEDLYCDCGAVMKCIWSKGLTHDPSHIHQCTECGIVSTEAVKYPNVRYEAKEIPDELDS